MTYEFCEYLLYKLRFIGLKAIYSTNFGSVIYISK